MRLKREFGSEVNGLGVEIFMTKNVTQVVKKWTLHDKTSKKITADTETSKYFIVLRDVP